MKTILGAALAVLALAAPAHAAYTVGGCDPTGDVPPNAVKACDVFGEVSATLVYKRWPVRGKATGWDCTYRSDYPRTLACTLTVYLRQPTRVRNFPYIVQWRTVGGRCTYRGSTDDLTFRVAFGKAGCLSASRIDV